MWVYQSVNIRLTNNAITNSRIVNLDSGKTTTQPVNTNGNMSIGFWSGLGLKIKKPGINVNFNPNFNYNKLTDIVNGRNSNNKTLSAGLSIYLSKSKDKKYDISIGNEFNYNSNNSTLYTSRINYFTNSLRIDATIYLHKVWSLSSDINFYDRQKTPQFNNNLSNQIWNAGLKRTFKKDVFTAYLLIKDILNQNTGIERNFYSNTLSEIRNDRIKRYWMVGFTWNFKNKTDGALAPKP
jgi:hypothetical protein